MPDYNEKLSELQQRLDKMVEYQGYFNREINIIRSEINALKQVSYRPSVKTQPQVPQPVIPKVEPPKVFESDAKPDVDSTFQFNQAAAPQNLHIEAFVGKNLISIIGIIITIIGVGIGSKYAIDRNMISPAMRIILGYVFSFGLLGIAFKLKKNYERFSAVLLSGAVAMMYFLTFFAYSFYGLISQPVAFAVMVVITVFTVFASLNYNRQIIAVIGLVGAYAVPFLLSDGSGRADILFGYMTLINIGILAVSIRKYWKFLYFSAFSLTWLIFIAWFADQYRYNTDFTLAMAFATVFFAIFYISFIAHKLFYKERFSIDILFLILANALIYFGLGCILIGEHNATRNYLGFFTIANAIIHFAVSYLVSERLRSKKMLYFTLGLALFFITIAVPIQMQWIWTPIFWTIEATYLFWVGYTKRIAFYEIASYILMGLASIGIFLYLAVNQVQWSNAYYNIDTASILSFQPFYNDPFLVSSIFVAGFGIICYLITGNKYQSCTDSDLFKFIKVAVSFIFLIGLYNLFRTEIGNYWQLQHVKTAFLDTVQYTDISEKQLVFDGDLLLYNIIWQINYTMLFLSILSFINIKWLKNVGFGFTLLTLNAFLLCVFTTVGLFLLSELRESFLLQTNAEHFIRGNSHIIIRYISLALAAILIFTSYRLYKQEFLRKVFDATAIFDMIFAVVLWIILSSELLNIMDIFGYQDSYKLALSLFWGSYSLILIILGIWWKKAHLRIGAIALFALTLVKLFFYDIASLGTISKTIVFVSLGVMLLIISFLYNKYKTLIFGDEEINH